MNDSEIFDILCALCPLPGVSGDEGAAADKACELLAPYGEARFDKGTGNVFFRRSGWQDGKPLVLLDAHIDEIGFIVTHITADGFLKVAACGGIDRRMLLAQQVSIYGTASGSTERLVGITASVPPHLAKDYSKCPEVEEVLIDTGFTSKDKACEHIALGDRVLVENSPERLLGDRVTAKAIDDRSGCAALIAALDKLKDEQLGCNVAVTLSSQEEVGERGAKTAAYTVKPDLAIEVDVSFANTLAEDDKTMPEPGTGVMIGIAPSLSRKLTKDMVSTAKRCGIPYTMEVMGGETGTNADAIGLARGGVPTVTLSIPLRYMHTPAEVVSLSDINSTAELISEFLKGVKEI